MTDLDLVFGSLADPTRRRILGLLREAGELKVGDIAQAFDMSLNGVSKHLKILERAGVITRRIEGRQHWISPDRRALGEALQWLSEHHEVWAARLERLGELVTKSEQEQQKS